jgi:glycerol-3-phosphate acyltransferase PlsY
LAGEESRTLVTVVTGAIAVLVLVRHIPNIKRILSGTEPPTMRARSPEGERS